jgi:hypothetical protein
MVPARLLTPGTFKDQVAVLRVAVNPDTSLLAEPLHGHAGIEGAMGGKAFKQGQNCGSEPCAGLNLRAAVWENSLFAGSGVLAAYNPWLFRKPTAAQFPPQACTERDSCFGESSYCLQNNGESIGRAPTPDNPGVCVQEHASTVAYLIGARRPGNDELPHKQQGSDWGLGYGAYNTTVVHAASAGIDGLEWALENNALYVNRSQGLNSPNASALVDWAARHQFVTVTLSSGNDPDRAVSGSGAYNAISVGSYRYGDWETRADDAVSFFSSWMNDPELLAERPHIVAPGQNLEVPSVCTEGYKLRPPPEDWISPIDCSGAGSPRNGTSFAAPIALGTVIRAHQYAGLFSELAHPGMRKAVLMAGAYDVAGDGEMVVDSNDSQDGAGAPDMRRIKAILDSNRFKRLKMTPQRFPLPQLPALGGLANVFVPAGHVLKAVMVQYACPEVGFSSKSELLNDFDLWVQPRTMTDVVVGEIPVRPSPTPVACNVNLSSASTTSEFEIVYQDCVANADVGAHFTIRVERKAGVPLTMCAGATSEPVFVAWDVRPSE